MAKITIEELSGSLREYLNGLGLTEEQVQGLIDKFEDEKVGDISQLSTTNKTNLVVAINEVFQSGNNVKQNLVDALIAKGVVCSTSDSFSKLISLIYGLTNDEGSGDDTGDENLPSFEGENTWATCKSMRVNRFALTSAVVDKKIYVIGGYNTGYCNNLEIYDTELGTWEDGPNMPSVLAYASAEAIDGKIYVIGGSNKTQDVGTPDNDTVLLATGKYRVFDTLLGTWSEISKKLMIHQYGETTGTSTAVIGNTIYFAGGHSEGARYNTIGAFNVETNTTTVLGDQYGGMQNTGMAHSALCAVNNKLYRFGGKGYGTNSLNNTSGSDFVITYDPINPTADSIWLEQGMPVSMHSMGYCVVNEKVYLIGGISGSGTFYNSTGGMNGTVQNSVYEYNPYTNKWTKVNTMLTPRFGHTLAVVDNVIYCIGGADSNKVPLNSMEVYCPPGIEPPVFGGGSGSSAGLNIISATELPEEVVENQIVIITDNIPTAKKIKDSSLSTPSIDGEVIVGIVTIPDDSGVEYNMLQNDIVVPLYLKVAKGYFDNRVTTYDAYIGINGNWIQFSKATLLVFDNGVDNLGINNSSNWTCINATLSQGEWNLGVNISGHGDNSWRDAGAWFKTKFDLTNYKTLKITGTANSSATVGFTKSPGTTASIEKSIPLKTTSSEITVDVSSLSGEYYLLVKGRTATSTYSAFSMSRFELLP